MTLQMSILLIFESVHCRSLVWHEKCDASSMTTDTSQSLMTETSQLNWHIRGSITLEWLHFIIQTITIHCLISFHMITAEQTWRQLFVVMKLARNLLSPSSRLRHTLQDRKWVSSLWARSKQIEQAQSEQGHRKRALVRHVIPGGHYWGYRSWYSVM